MARTRSARCFRRCCGMPPASARLERRLRNSRLKRVAPASEGPAMDRRAFLGSAAAGAAAAGLRHDRRPPPRAPAACRRCWSRRTGSSAPSPASAPIAPSGFVVRAERSGDKRLVHNYGHGGAGITLSWGTSRLATQLGLPGHQGPVAVIGAGVMGLTTARLVQEAGFPVTHLRRGAAAGHDLQHRRRPMAALRPLSATIRSRREWRAQFAAASTIAGAASRSWSATITAYAGCPPIAGGERPRGACSRPSRRAAAARAGRASVPGRALSPASTRMYVETGRFLRQLMRDVQLAGGAIRGPPLRDARPRSPPCRRAGLQLHRARRRDLFGDTELDPGSRPARHPAAAAGGPLRLHRRRRLHVPARRRHRPRRHVRARCLGDEPEPERSPGSRVAPAPLRRLPLHRLNSSRRAPSSWR